MEYYSITTLKKETNCPKPFVFGFQVLVFRGVYGYVACLLFFWWLEAIGGFDTGKLKKVMVCICQSDALEYENKSFFKHVWLIWGIYVQFQGYQKRYEQWGYIPSS